jgi:lipoprotein-releasing system ATP-binding protein
MSIPVLQARRVSRTLPGPVPVNLVRDIDLTVEAGDFVAITGPSGSGKSSLLYLLGLLDVPTSGAILLDGVETGELDADTLAELRLTKLGFVFQFHFLLPEFTALGNVTLPMRKKGGAALSDMEARAAEILRSLGLEALVDKRPDQLSGGERQRVAIARALANDPQIILADEPTGNLDSKNGALVFDIFARLVAEEGRTVITVTHDRELAARAHRQLRIVDGRLAPS